MTLAVATQDPNAPAETYVRQHMRKLKPGGTVGLGLACSDAPPTDLPFLCLGPVEGRWRSKLASLESLLRSGYAAAVPRRREAEVTRFLAAHRVEAVLAEFGTTGCALRRICKERDIRLVVNFHGYDATVMPKRPRSATPTGCSPATPTPSSAARGTSAASSWASASRRSGCSSSPAASRSPSSPRPRRATPT